MQSTYTWVAPPTLSFPPPNFPNPKAKLSTTTTTITTFTPPKLTQTNSSREADRFPLPLAHVKSITSTSNPFVKHCLKLLHNSSYRHSHGSVLVVGSTPIRTWLNFSLMPIKIPIYLVVTTFCYGMYTYREICESQESLQERTIEMDCLLLLDETEVPEIVNKASAHVVRVSSVVMKKLSQVQSTESIDAIALMRFPTSYFVLNNHQNNVDCRKWFPSPHRILVLEGIQDPGNLGTLLRSAVAFRWGGVFLLPGCCDPFNGKALRASRGASFQLPIVSGSWYHLEALKDEYKMKLLGGHPDSNGKLKPVSQLSQWLADFLADVPSCLVLGSEGHGLSEKAQQECELISIPMEGEFESLNVAVAGGIFLYMLRPRNRQIV